MSSFILPLALMLFVFGVAIFLWQVRSVRVATRSSLGRRHAKYFGAMHAKDVEKDDDEVEEKEEPETGLDSEKAAFNMDLFGPLPPKDA